MIFHGIETRVSWNEKDINIGNGRRSLCVLISRLRGRGASYTERSHSESGGGLYRSENAGISSENYVRIIMAESLRF